MSQLSFKLSYARGRFVQFHIILFWSTLQGKELLVHVKGSRAPQHAMYSSSLSETETEVHSTFFFQRPFYYFPLCCIATTLVSSSDPRQTYLKFWSGESCDSPNHFIEWKLRKEQSSSSTCWKLGIREEKQCHRGYTVLSQFLPVEILPRFPNHSVTNPHPEWSGEPLKISFSQ